MPLHRDQQELAASEANSVSLSPTEPKVDVIGRTLDEAQLEDLRRMYQETEAKVKVNRFKAHGLELASATATIGSFIATFLALVVLRLSPVWGLGLCLLVTIGFRAAWSSYKRMEACRQTIQLLEDELEDLDRRAEPVPSSHTLGVPSK